MGGVYGTTRAEKSIARSVFFGFFFRIPMPRGFFFQVTFKMLLLEVFSLYPLFTGISKPDDPNFALPQPFDTQWEYSGLLS